MKLKTLKDIDDEADDSYSTCGSYTSDIRQEAIKHYKALTHYKAIAKVPSSKEDVFVRWQVIGQMVWIKDFFNISEEELKK